MIFDLILDAFEALLVWFAGLLPTTGVNAFDGWFSVLNQMTALNYFLPISEVFSFVIGVFVIFPVLTGMSLLAWVVSFIRGGSARA